MRLAIIGCGAVTREFHLPAAMQVPGVEISAVVDTNMKFAVQAAEFAKSARPLSDYKDVKDIDGVIVAVPHFLHAPICQHFLDLGVHVLCEKPLALNLLDAKRLVDVAKEKELDLATGVFRRYYPTSSFIQRVVDCEWFGEITGVDAEEGGAYDWNLQSPFMMKRSQAGGGVLVDTGSHTVDRILHWFEGAKATVVEYRDNSYGESVESDCVLKFELRAGERSVPVRVELSRTRTLRNTFIIHMKNGFVETPVNDPFHASFIDKRLDKGDGVVEAVPIDLSAKAGPEVNITDKMPFFVDQIRDFVSAVRQKREPVNSGISAIRTVEVIESAYNCRQTLDEPWVHVPAPKIFKVEGSA